MDLPPSIDLAIIGAGPQALTLVTHLLQKRARFRPRFVVFDPSGTWLTQWHRQFAAQAIPHLRSPAVHHPDPDAFALRRFAEGRSDELFPPYDLPGTRLFQEFCAEVVQRWQLEQRVYPAKVVQLLPIGEGRRSRFQIGLENGSVITARRVLLATGAGIPQIPDWAEHISMTYPLERLCHAQQVNLNTLLLVGERILIVGGGLTSGHLAMGAIQRGATVTLMTRRWLQEKLFDANPGWLGPKYLKGFKAEPCWLNRWHRIQQARNGGSLTPTMMLNLRQAERQGKLVLEENCHVVSATWQAHSEVEPFDDHSRQHWQIHCDNGSSQSFDRIWLATGTRFDLQQHELLQEVLTRYPAEMVQGLPVLDFSLRIPGCECFIMGGLAALQIGPVARNLFGGKLASERIVPALIKG
ncbi:MAG: lysine N(6)-hydroxylase/L-ornithine N(5)-oxygenase family protein [Oscillatoriales cyanobacterium RM2_1_1]|nr:lysine N(6)-hydroxylase/L-ornithine N(5)-oxygenase family protein [Oscillatoriales cyanobacterium SM2_3_0]NJO47987.1 lysine N(6)-hydroxylase/L-ornithine N(5)-oxygenase family protein [Oscillatoriales cyanobacterium RM2_1_1]